MEIVGNELSTEKSNLYCCDFCNYNTCKKSNYESHLKTFKHIKFLNELKNPNIIHKKYICEICNYNTIRKSNLINHLKSIRHKEIMEKTTEFKPIENKVKKENECQNCQRKFKTNSGLWKHKQKCETKPDNKKDSFEFNKELFFEFLKNNQDFQKELFMDMQKQMFDFMKTNMGSNNNSNNNSNNKTFNLQVFLNETCKDAMNIMDFVDSIQLQLTDLESVGELGYVKGITNIIKKNLIALDVTQRPVHCSDIKREIIYIKDNDKWEKEDPENNKLRKAIKYISHKNILLLSKWRETYPDSQLSDSPQNDKYHHMVVEAMGGEGSTDTEKINKIIRNIAKEVVIDK